MPAIIRIVLLVILGLGTVAPAVASQALSPAERQIALTALAAAGKGEWAKAYAAALPIKNPLPLKMVHWLDYTRSNAGARFAEIAQFIDNNPHWPRQQRLLRAAEAALAAESDATAAAWFKQHPPISAVGKARAAEIEIAHGEVARGTAALRAIWIEGNFAPADERNFWTRHGAAMRPQDNATRLDRLLWDRKRDAARRMLPLVPPDQRALAEARLAFAAQASNANALLAKVPASLRTNPGLLFAELRWRRSRETPDAAAQILLAHPGDPVHPAAWWPERQTLARQLLAEGNIPLAYRIVREHGDIAGNALSEADFLSGYIALRYLKKPALAIGDFSRALAHAAGPYARARASYWGGRAAAAEDQPALARKWFADSAANTATFYGQLAAHTLGNDAPPHPMPDPRPSAVQTARFNAEELVRATRLFFAAGERSAAGTFVMRLASQAKTAIDFSMLASLAEQHGRVDLAIAVAHRAIDAGLPLTVHGYPVTALPAGGTTERPLLLAIVRQESAFAPDAISSAGARGLMQLMPATAAGIAAKMQVPFSITRLTGDGLYNLLLGRAYLERLIEDFGGSYALAIAAYNAGPARVRQWLHELGDPRGRGIDMVDWIELIPYSETRNYVERVLENLQIYREQSGDKATAFSLVSDLAR